MVFTSVSGHLMEKDFEAPYRRNWQSCAPGDLFHLPVVNEVPEKNKNILQTLQAESRSAQWLILWLDCDREGENIAFEVIEVCRRFVLFICFLLLFFFLSLLLLGSSLPFKFSGPAFQKSFTLIFKEPSTTLLLPTKQILMLLTLDQRYFTILFRSI